MQGAWHSPSSRWPPPSPWWQPPRCRWCSWGYWWGRSKSWQTWLLDCWGINLRGPNHPRDPAPLGPPIQRGQGDRLVHYQFILETGLRTETNVGDHNKQTISWSFEYSLPRSQSKAGWFRCFCLGLQSTTECSGAFGLKCNKKSLSLSSMKAKLEQFQNSRLMQILTVGE